MIENTIHSDLMFATEDIIAHQVNCQGVMSSGVANAIRSTFPEAYERFIAIGANDNHLGRVQLVKTSSGTYIANLFGQKTFGRSGIHTNYDALRSAFKTLSNYALKNNLTVAMPYKIGSDRGGGEWSVIKTMINEEFIDVPVTLYKL